MVGAKIISVSIPKEDKIFCISRNLSPSKLLQERISQIRDENNPSLVKNLLEERKHGENLKAKLEFMSSRVLALGNAISERFGEETTNEILQKI